MKLVFSIAVFLVAALTACGRSGDKVSAVALLRGDFNFQTCTVSGTIADACLSELDAEWMFLVLNCDGEQLYASFPLQGRNPAAYERLIGAEVAVTGVYAPHDLRYRNRMGRIFKMANGDAMRVIRPSQNRYANLPPIEETFSRRPSEIATLGRHRATGRVLAVWSDRKALVKTACDALIGVEFANDKLPKAGDIIDVFGFPESDLYNINLIRARWRIAPVRSTVAPETVEPLSADKLTTDERGKPFFRADYHGKTIRLDGTVIALPPAVSNDRFLYLDCDSVVVPVNVNALPAIDANLTPGCRVTVTGVCIMDAENWRPNAIFTQIKGFFVVARTADDIVIVARPPWWTPGRLAGVIGALLFGISGILVWNFLLRKLATRKGRELMREQLRYVKADLKTEERTRLAVELHDSLAQNLTGVSLEIDTSAKMADEDPSGMKLHLAVAARALKSCRDELRNCLWDLRNRALEEDTMDSAIRQTLTPHVPETEIDIRFNVPRDRLSDSSAHAILRIVRELTLNAVRHGGATKVWISGNVDDRRLLFSVCDNGSGFDPKSAPGFAEGHYGLVGIRERVDEFEGEFTLTSAVGKGTKATVVIDVPKANDQEEPT